MTRPRCSSRAWRLTAVVDRPAGRLGKLAACVGGSRPVWRRPGFKHLRFATPARGSIHHRRCEALSRSLGPSQDRVRLTPQDTGQPRTMFARGSVE